MDVDRLLELVGGVVIALLLDLSVFVFLHILVSFFCPLISRQESSELEGEMPIISLMLPR
jgi:hypothetical protein